MGLVSEVPNHDLSILTFFFIYHHSSVYFSLFLLTFSLSLSLSHLYMLLMT